MVIWKSIKVAIMRLVKKIVKKYAYLLSCQELNEKTPLPFLWLAAG